MNTPDLSEFPHLTSRCFISVTFPKLVHDQLPYFLDKRLHPEISLETDMLWSEPRSTFKRVAHTLNEQGLSCTFHAPFLDLVPGGFEPKILALTREKLRRAFDLLELFQPKSIVCHLGYEQEKHGFDRERWLDVSIATWSELLPIASDAGVQVMFENTFEKDPSIHRQIFKHLEPYSPGFCLDTGHVLCFSTTPWREWFRQLSPWLGQLHIHDNDGSADSHGILGTGDFEFSQLFNTLDQRGKTVICTLEQHPMKKVYESLKVLDQMNYSALNIP